MAETATRECRRNAWLVALAGGALVALMLLLLAQFGVLKALMLGAVAGLVLGIFLVWAFCSQGIEDGVPQSRPATPAPARPEPLAAAGPAVEPVAEPVPERMVPAAPEPAPERRPEPTTQSAPSSAPPAFVSAQPGGRPAPVPEAAPAPAGTAPRTPQPRKSRAAGLDAALAKSRDEPPAPAPGMLAAPRGGRADDLKLINGIGPKIEALLNGIGVWHFDQIAAWKAKDIAHVDERLVGFHGRITRDEWVKQAKALAAGGVTRRGVPRGKE